MNMNRILAYFSVISIAALFWSCQKEGYGNYPGGEVSPYISLYDVRTIYKGQPITLDKENLFGSTSIAAVVVSDHAGNNLPDGLLIVQDNRRLNQQRGIAIPLGSDAKNYMPGDSLVIKIEGGVLNRVNGILQLTGITGAQISKITKVDVLPVVVPAANITANPDRYESTLVAIVDGSFIPLPQAGQVLSGDKTLNDGSGNVTLHTESGASFASNELFGRANYFGILLNKEGADGQLTPQFVPRIKEDIILLSSSIEIAPILISGFVSDAKGTDNNYEYMQFLAVVDIDFSKTPYSVVTTNNAGASTPTGVPKNSWATGGLRTYKFNLTSGTAKKGTFFYVGTSNKMINGSASTSIASSNWIRSFNYGTTNGDGFGTKTTNLLANSGNASGIAVFKGTTVALSTEPIDVIFIGSGGSLYDAGQPEYGYRITSNDLYKSVDLISLTPQPFYRSGSNTFNFPYSTSDMGFFNRLGGKYNTTMGRWTQRREQRTLLMEKTSEISFIEDSLSTKLMRIEGTNEVEDN